MLKIISKIIFLLCALHISIEMDGQHIRRYSENSRELTFEENLEIAEELFRLQLYYPAMGYYEKAKSIDSIDLEYKYKLAECYRKLRYYYNASESYQQVWEEDPDLFPDALLYQGIMSLAEGNLQAAQDILLEYKQQNNNGDKAISSYAEMQMKNVAFAMEEIKQQNKIDIEGLNKEINQPQTTFSTSKWEDETLLYSSAIAISHPLLKNYTGFKGIFDTVYVNRLWQCVNVNDQWTNRQMIEIEPESEFLSIGSPFWLESHERLYYTVCSNVDEKKPCQIYYSNLKKNGDWSKGVALGSNVNRNNSSTKHPMVLEYNDGYIIFYSSDREGGYGGFDLWYSKIDKSGKISAPENLGPSVNTPYDEVTPFLHESSKNLFFSSNGHKGFGELDVFMIRLDLKQKTGKLYHLDYPINSTADDYYYTVNDDGYGGFLSSNRSSDLFASYSSYADKLYKIRFQSPFSFSQLPDYITEINSFSESEAKLNLFNEEFAFQFLDASESALVMLEENDVVFSGQLLFGDSPSVNRNILLENEQGEIVGQTMSDENGYFEFRGLPADGSYMLVLNEKDSDMTIHLNYTDQNSNTISSFNSNESSAFYKYKNLENYFSSVDELDMMEENDVVFSGQLLFGEDPSINRNVLLENEHGEIVAQTMTDENGYFEFRGLPADGSYMMVLDVEDAGMTIYLDYKDQNGNTISSINSKESNQFYKYKNLDNYFTSVDELDMMEENDAVFSGQLLFGEDPSINRNVLLENEHGEIVAQTMSDENGYFEFRGLPADGSYMLVLNEEDSEMTIHLNYKDQNGNTISSFNSNESNQFYRFKNLENYFSSVDKLDTDDKSAFAMDESDVENHFKRFMTPAAYSDLESKFSETIFDDILIRVQIGAYRHPKPGLFDHMKEIGNIDEDYVNDMTKFLIGRFDRIAEAEPLRVSAHDQGIEDAFIAIYYKGKRVSAIYF